MDLPEKALIELLAAAIDGRVLSQDFLRALTVLLAERAHFVSASGP